MSHLSIHPESHEPPKMDRLTAADGILADLEAATRILRHFFCTQLDWEQGLTFEELYDLDCTLELEFTAARNRVDEIYAAERAAAGLLPPLEEKLPGLRSREDPDGGD